MQQLEIYMTIDWFAIMRPAVLGLKLQGVSLNSATSRTLNFLGRDQWQGQSISAWVRAIYEEK